MSQIPPLALRRLIQAASEIAAAVDESKPGKAVRASIAALATAIDAYGEGRQNSRPASSPQTVGASDAGVAEIGNP